MNTIYLPSNDQYLEMVKNAWADFIKQANEAGVGIEDIPPNEVFLWGYCVGNNDCLNVIRDQLDIAQVENQIFNNNH